MDGERHDRDAIDRALRFMSHGVYVLGTRRGRQSTGMTVSWVTQASERPPSVAVCVRDDRYTRDLVLESGTFSLSILREDQVNVATHFGSSSGEYEDKLQGVPYGLTQNGSPFLIDCLAYLDCRVLDTARAGDYTVIVGEITSADTLGNDYPLLFDPGEYEGALR